MAAAVVGGMIWYGGEGAGEERGAWHKKMLGIWDLSGSGKEGYQTRLVAVEGVFVLVHSRYSSSHGRSRSINKN